MAYITGNLFTITRNASIYSLSFELTTPGVLSNSDLYHAGSKKVDANESTGAFSVELGPGDYNVKVGTSTSNILKISVPDNDNTYTIDQRVIESAVYTPTTPAGGAQPAASDTVAGLVKTNTDPGGGSVAVVYSTDEIDTFLTGLTGGVASDVGGIPTFDFSHTTVANFIFSNGILNIGIASDGITPIFSVAGTP